MWTYVERNEHLDRTYSSKPSHRSKRSFQFYRYLCFSLSSLYHLLSYKRQKQLLIVRWCALWEKDLVYSFSSKNLRVLPNFPLLDCPWVSISIHKYPWYIPWSSHIKSETSSCLFVQVLAASRDLCHRTFSSRKATSPPQPIPTEDNDVAGSSSVQCRGRESGECSFKVWISLNICFG